MRHRRQTTTSRASAPAGCPAGHLSRTQPLSATLARRRPEPPIAARHHANTRRRDRWARARNQGGSVKSLKGDMARTIMRPIHPDAGAEPTTAGTGITALVIAMATMTLMTLKPTKTMALKTVGMGSADNLDNPDSAGGCPRARQGGHGPRGMPATAMRHRAEADNSRPASNRHRRRRNARVVSSGS